MENTNLKRSLLKLIQASLPIAVDALDYRLFVDPKYKKLESKYGTETVKAMLYSLKKEKYLATGTKMNAIKGPIPFYHSLSQKGIDFLN